jgi:hypothetical protein
MLFNEISRNFDFLCLAEFRFRKSKSGFRLIWTFNFVESNFDRNSDRNSDEINFGGYPSLKAIEFRVIHRSKNSLIEMDLEIQ